jgi:hypothetical protein
MREVLQVFKDRPAQLEKQIEERRQRIVSRLHPITVADYEADNNDRAELAEIRRVTNNWTLTPISSNNVASPASE